MMITRLQELVEIAQEGPPTRVAVAAAAHRLVLESVQRSVERGLVIPLLVGIESEIREQAEAIGWELQDDQIVATNTNLAAADAAVDLSGRAWPRC